jgi:hypothetical protein
MQCRFRVYGEGRILAEHVGEVLDKDDIRTINRIELTAFTKARAVAGLAPIRDFRVRGRIFFDPSPTTLAATEGGFTK